MMMFFLQAQRVLLSGRGAAPRAEAMRQSLHPTRQSLEAQLRGLQQLVRRL
jgi:hypothetical protein